MQTLFRLCFLRKHFRSTAYWKNRPRFIFAILSALVAIEFLPELSYCQQLNFPAVGIYNGYLEQTNILECDNSNSSELALTLTLLDNSGASIVAQSFLIPAFGSRHIILTDLANLSQRYGTFSLSYLSGPVDFAKHLACRTSFYRNSTAGSPKLFEFAYVLPLQNATTGNSGGMYNSFDPSGRGTPTYNWLGVVNRSGQNLSATIEVYDFFGTLDREIRFQNLAPGARQDFALGHDLGETSGTYLIRPDNSASNYQAFVVRYGPTTTGRFRFAFPLQALPGTCANQVVQTSTMNNGLTQNWIELANLGAGSENLSLTFRNRFGEQLLNENLTVPAHGQLHRFANSSLDPDRLGNVGTASIDCSNQSAPVIAQSAYYGFVPGIPGVEWSYAVQGGTSASAGNDKQVVVPVNTYLGMFNWFKAVNNSTVASPLEFTLLNQNGTAIKSGAQAVASRGSADIGVHSFSGSDRVGTFISGITAVGSLLQGEMLRVLPRTDGQIGYIMHIPSTVQEKITLPEPPSGYFPSDAVWYQDISGAPLDSESTAVIQWLQSVGGWGGGSMRIDFSIEVLNAEANLPLSSFIPTEDFYSPDCDFASVPVPPGGALEGESGYQCTTDGDCHLIVVDQSRRKLYEMWRANFVGDTFYGGCLAVWNMDQVYPGSGRGEQCTSADAAGFPIAPLLFSADEVAAGEINHAIRFILPNSRIRNRVYVHPATHSTGAASGPNTAPPYGARLRLRANYPLENLPNEGARVVARAMQKYGILLSDGGTIALTGQSDRFTTAKWEGLLGTRDLSAIQISDFEMVDGGQRYTWTGDCVRN